MQITSEQRQFLTDLQQEWTDHNLGAGCSVCCSQDERNVAKSLEELGLLKIVDEWKNGEFEVELIGSGVP